MVYRKQKKSMIRQCKNCSNRLTSYSSMSLIHECFQFNSIKLKIKIDEVIEERKKYEKYKMFPQSEFEKLPEEFRNKVYNIFDNRNLRIKTEFENFSLNKNGYCKYYKKHWWKFWV